MTRVGDVLSAQRDTSTCLPGHGRPLAPCTHAWVWSATYPIPHGAEQRVSLQVEAAKGPLCWPMCSKLDSKAKDSKVMMDTAGLRVTAWRRAIQGRCEAPTVRRAGRAHCGQALRLGLFVMGAHMH